ncbi:hypothetical protein BS47DRAFT_1390114 [Hydnum rufescens UP504]|uniref:Uncharacterized protein n=1 Tax=Hydnum rufescens UP504 TaxID=1448309 RepID=A0A9P6B690_9AGAM|nr:hypothetical protein BS47DRAFT_1390114 [Hydnum rufescens UP504]
MHTHCRSIPGGHHWIMFWKDPLPRGENPNRRPSFHAYHLPSSAPHDPPQSLPIPHTSSGPSFASPTEFRRSAPRLQKSKACSVRWDAFGSSENKFKPSRPLFGVRSDNLPDCQLYPKIEDRGNLELWDAPNKENRLPPARMVERRTKSSVRKFGNGYEATRDQSGGRTFKPLAADQDGCRARHALDGKNSPSKKILTSHSKSHCAHILAKTGEASGLGRSNRQGVGGCFPDIAYGRLFSRQYARAVRRRSLAGPEARTTAPNRSKWVPPHRRLIQFQSYRSLTSSLIQSAISHPFDAHKDPFAHPLAKMKLYHQLSFSTFPYIPSSLPYELHNVPTAIPFRPTRRATWILCPAIPNVPLSHSFTNACYAKPRFRCDDAVLPTWSSPAEI